MNAPQLVRFGRAICGELAQAERREWWLANGRGAYTAGTVAGTLTRRYHGLLVAPVHPPLGRVLVVAKADATLLLRGQQFPLFANRWGGGTVDPQGQLLLESFHLDGRMPVWRHRAGAAAVETRIWMEPGRNTTYVAYRLEEGADDAQLSIRLLVNGRDHHGTSVPGSFQPSIEPDRGGLRIAAADAFVLRVLAVGGNIEPRCDWHENFDLPVERERGLPDRDRHLCAGEARLQMQAGTWVGLAVSLEDDVAPDLAAAMQSFIARDAALIAEAHTRVPELAAAPEWIDQLLLAADSFVFARPVPGVPDGQSVIAGYPWFGDWGRDTMIALPGLALASGRHDIARSILETFAGFIDRGMLPNVFPGAGDVPAYNAADAALWYIEAWRGYVAATGDIAALRRHFPALAGIVDWHCRGTRYGIRIDPADGLLRAGEAGVQLTWMDAKVGDWVVTPRIGKPVELNALWYNALAAMAEFAQCLALPDAEYRMLASRCGEGFARFRLPDDQGGLYDVIDGPGGADASVRPNQIFAVSLPASPLDRATQYRIVDVCARELFTSFGLRSLSPRHRDYRGIYSGGILERDGSYHQGPVWAWLLAHFALAEFRVHGDAAAAQRRLDPMRDHLFDAGLGSVSEIFDGDAPHLPRGAPCQAWSVACVLEAWWHLERARIAHRRSL